MHGLNSEGQGHKFWPQGQAHTFKIKDNIECQAKCKDWWLNLPINKLKFAHCTATITKHLMSTSFLRIRFWCTLSKVRLTPARPQILVLRPGTKARFPLLELTARVDGWPVSITRQHGPCWRARISTSGVDGPSTRFTWLTKVHLKVAIKMVCPCVWRYAVGLLETGWIKTWFFKQKSHFFI